MATHSLDLKGLNCPMPVMKLKQGMAGIQSGDSLDIVATDPGAAGDFETYCQSTGDQIIKSEAEAGGIYRFLIQKA